MRRPPRISKEAVIGIDGEIADALELATAFFQTTVSQYGRAKIIEGLVRDGFIVHPATTLQQKRSAPAKPEIKSVA
jgi:hypothetical protein